MWDIYLTRTTVNRLNPGIIRKNLRAVASAVEESPGFSAKLGPLQEPTRTVTEEGEAWLYQVRLRVRYAGDSSPDLVKKQWGAVQDRARAKAARKGWEMGDAPHAPPKAGVEGGSLPPFVLPELTQEVLDRYFPDIYERDPHLRILHAAVRTSLTSQGKVLSHVLLYGEPGACKTKLVERLKAWYEEGESSRERVVFIDGTTMTKAGLERFLLGLADAERLPEVLVVDELEKQPMDNLLAMNNVMGSGVLTRLNAHTGNLRVPATFTVVGICNDEKALKEFRNGALWSRFTHKVYCPRPTRPFARLILEGIAREMGACGMAQAWADAALAFGWDELGQRDVREIKGHLDGREGLLDGSWQRDKRATSPPG